MIDKDKAQFVFLFNQLCAEMHEYSKRHGFWIEGKQRNFGEMIALVHSELSEALEAARVGNSIDEKLPDFNCITVELADAIIRIMDIAGGYAYPLGHAIIAKMKFNETRPHMHGKQF